MDIFVYADWQGLNGPMMMGTLKVIRTKGHGVFSFEYHKEWIKQGKGIRQNIPSVTIWQLVYHLYTFVDIRLNPIYKSR